MEKNNLFLYEIELLQKVMDLAITSAADTAIRIFKDIFNTKYSKAYECIDKD